MSTPVHETVSTQMQPIEEVVHTLVRSYKFSRGSQEAQRFMLEWLVERDRPAFEGLDLAQVHEQLRGIVLRIAQNTKVHPVKVNKINGDTKTLNEADVDADLDTLFSVLPKIIEGRPSPYLLGDLATKLLNIDLTWRTATSGFETPSKKYVTPLPFRSNVIHFGLLGRARLGDNGNSTAHEAYDEMFGKVADKLLSPEGTPYYHRRLGRLATTYIEHRPAAAPLIAEILSL